MSKPDDQSTAAGPPEDVLKTRRQTVEAFVVRARRIEAHSLLSDKDQFLAWVRGTARFQIVPSDGIAEPVATTITFDLPPEESFESLAARVRPLTLKGDPVHHDTVINALKTLVRADPERLEQISELGTAWRKVKQPDQPILMGLAPALDKPDNLSSYVEVAEAWLYADLVHCDPQRLQQIGTLTLNQRYIAAVLVYGQSALYAVAVLNLIRQWQAAGLLELKQAAFNEPTTVNLPLVLPIERMKTTPATPPEAD